MRTTLVILVLLGFAPAANAQSTIQESCPGIVNGLAWIEETERNCPNGQTVRLELEIMSKGLGETYNKLCGLGSFDIQANTKRGLSQADLDFVTGGDRFCRDPVGYIKHRPK